MPEKGNTPYHKCLVSAQQTINLINHRHTPDRVCDAILNVLIAMSAEYRVNIWEEKTGLNLETLAALYSLLERGGGRRIFRVHADDEARLRRERQRQNRGQK